MLADIKTIILYILVYIMIVVSDQEIFLLDNLYDLPSGTCNHLPDQTLMPSYFPYRFTLCCLSGCHSDIWSSHEWLCTLSRTAAGSLQSMTRFTASGWVNVSPVHMTISFETQRQVHLCKMNHTLMQTRAFVFYRECKRYQNSKRKLV